MKEVFLFLFIGLTLCYFPLNKRASRYYFQTYLDTFIPIISLFIIPYFLFYIFKFWSLFALWNTQYVLPFLASLNIAYIPAILLWYFVPNGVKRVPVEEKSIWAKMINYLYAHDNDTNGFPSGHVFITINVAYFLVLANPANSFFIWILAALICASTVLIKQHYIVDVFGGIFLSIISIMAALYLF